MKLTFSFTNSPDPNQLSGDNVYNSHFEIPDDIKHLIGYEQRILAIATSISQLSDAALHLSCNDLNIKNHPIKLTNNPKRVFNREFVITVLQFERLYYNRNQSRQLKIYVPIYPVIPQNHLTLHGKNKRERNSLTRNLIRLGTYWCKTEEEHAYASTVSSLVDQILMLLNAEPITDLNHGWRCKGFHPWWNDNTLIDRYNERQKKREAEERKRKKLEEQRLLKEARLAQSGQLPTEIPKTGAGRRYGARPGKFMGVQMRSQLEIRFAAELEERKIQWVYESETLGEGGYLVDFYLTSLRCWVEVKGQFEPRDNFLLKEVAEYLKRERQQKLFVYMQRKAFIVNPSGFREISHDEFWSMLFK